MGRFLRAGLILAFALSAVASWDSAAVTCQDCTKSAADALEEWAIVEPKLAEELPDWLCSGFALGGVCATVVEQVIVALGQALNKTSPVALCKKLGLCANASSSSELLRAKSRL